VFDANERASCVGEIGAFLTRLPAAPLVVIKEPTGTSLHCAWFAPPRLAGFDIHEVIAVSHPQEAIASFAGAPSSLAGALDCLMAEMHSAGRDTHARPAVRVRRVRQLLNNWRREIKRISMALTIDLTTRDEGAIEDYGLAVFALSLHHLPAALAARVFAEGTRAANKLLIIDLHVWRRSWGATACTLARFTARRTTRHWTRSGQVVGRLPCKFATFIAGDITEIAIDCPHETMLTAESLSCLANNSHLH
jgi:hypothetical protein